MRMKFKILYPQDYHDESKRGKQYKPPPKHMVVMNSDGVFFEYCGEAYCPFIKKLCDVLPKYDVLWREIV